MRKVGFAALIAALWCSTALPAFAVEPAQTSTAVQRALRGARIQAGAVLDPATGKFLAGREADRKLAPASLLKMVTALVVAQKLQPDDEVTISRRAALSAHDTLQWRIGATFTVDQVLHGMMMQSSNGAAVALAERAAGSVTAFRTQAAELLRSMGISNTRLIDPSGLDARGQYSTARDLARIAAAVLEHPWLHRVVNTQRFELPWPDGGSATFSNLNHYFGRDPSAIGVKNGYTSTAGNCVAAASQRRDRTLIVIALRGADVYADARRIMDAAFGFKPDPAPTAPADQAAEADGVMVEVESEPPAPAVAQPVTQPVTQQIARSEARPRAGGFKKLMIVVVMGAYVVRVRQVQVKRRRRARRRELQARRAA